MSEIKELSVIQLRELLNTLENRFFKNINRHKDILWEDVLANLNQNKYKYYALYNMEMTDGEPDVVFHDEEKCKCQDKNVRKVENNYVQKIS